MAVPLLVIGSVEVKSSRTMNAALTRPSSAGGVRGGLLPPVSPQLNDLSSYQALAGADIRSLEQECHDHPSLPCACTE